MRSSWLSAAVLGRPLSSPPPLDLVLLKLLLVRLWLLVGGCFVAVHVWLLMTWLVAAGVTVVVALVWIHIIVVDGAVYKKIPEKKRKYDTIRKKTCLKRNPPPLSSPPLQKNAVNQKRNYTQWHESTSPRQKQNKNKHHSPAPSADHSTAPVLLRWVVTSSRKASKFGHSKASSTFFSSSFGTTWSAHRTPWHA